MSFKRTDAHTQNDNDKALLFDFFPAATPSIRQQTNNNTIDTLSLDKRAEVVAARYAHIGGIGCFWGL